MAIKRIELLGEINNFQVMLLDDNHTYQATIACILISNDLKDIAGANVTLYYETEK